MKSLMLHTEHTHRHTGVLINIVLFMTFGLLKPSSDVTVWSTFGTKPLGSGSCYLRDVLVDCTGYLISSLKPEFKTLLQPVRDNDGVLTFYLQIKSFK